MKKPKHEQPVRWPQHKMGKHCGYNEHEDGSIEIADSHAQQMALALSEQEGIDSLIAAVNSHAAKMYKRTATLRRAFWDGVQDDYGLDFEKFDYFYEAHGKRIKREPKPEEGKK